MTILCKHINIDTIEVGIVIHHTFQIYNRVTAFIETLFQFNIWKMNGQNLTKVCMYIHIDNIC